MSIFSSAETTLLSFANRIQDAIGDVIFSFTGIMTSDLVNEAVFYILAIFVLCLAWLLFKPSESVYHYRSNHHH